MPREIGFGTDFEGPWGLGDNAFEICRDKIPKGAQFFSQVSRYDDVLVDIVKRPGYKAGDTLKLVAPFLKAFGLTDKGMRDYSLQTMSLVPGAIEAMGFLHRVGFAPIHIISTSYAPYALAGAEKLGIGAEHVFSTRLNIDELPLARKEAGALVRLAAQIAAQSRIDLPEKAKSLHDLSPQTREIIGELDRIFWDIIPKMKVGRAAYEQVNPVGGSEKAAALRKIAQKTGISFSDFIYPGDSITDREAFNLIRSAGGLTISFNGNSYATQTAEFIVASNTAWPTVLLALVFRQWRIAGVKKMISIGAPVNLQHLMLNLDPGLQVQLEAGLRSSRYVIYDSAACDLQEATAASKFMRGDLRGGAIAALG